MKKDATKYKLPTSYATWQIARLRRKLWSDRVMSREFERQKKRALEGMAP
jgi:hypothetical protein